MHTLLNGAELEGIGGGGGYVVFIGPPVPAPKPDGVKPIDFIGPPEVAPK